jgi:hypothetical protein
MKIFKKEVFWTLLTILPIMAFLIASIVVSEKVRQEKEEVQVVSSLPLMLRDSKVVYFEKTHEKEFKIPVVKFNINGITACFIVDTGSNGSILDYKWYKENSELFIFKKDTYIDYVGISGVSTIRTVYVDGFVNGINVNFTTSDLSEIIKTLKNHNLNVVGILGSIYLEKNNYIIDYNTKSIYRKFN